MPDILITHWSNIETCQNQTSVLDKNNSFVMYKIFVKSLVESEQVPMYKKKPSRLDYIKFIKSITDLQDSSKVLQSNKFYFEIGECLFN